MASAVSRATAHPPGRGRTNRDQSSTRHGGASMLPRINFRARGPNAGAQPVVPFPCRPALRGTTWTGHDRTGSCARNRGRRCHGGDSAPEHPHGRAPRRLRHAASGRSLAERPGAPVSCAHARWARALAAGTAARTQRRGVRRKIEGARIGEAPVWCSSGSDAVVAERGRASQGVAELRRFRPNTILC